MKKLFLILLLVICSNFVTKAWCVLCVREHSALELLKQENDHTLFMATMNENRTMLEEVTVTNLDDNTLLTLEEKYNYNYESKTDIRKISGVKVSKEDFDNAYKKSKLMK